MNRPSIPAEIRRAVLVEAGHRCAIPRCGNTELDIHHIVPWSKCKTHEYQNLIALCPICHRRAHKKEIDRNSLRQYKKLLISEFTASDSAVFQSPATEVKRKISHTDLSKTKIGFDFEFPDFQDPTARIVSRNIELWGNEFLVEYQNGLKVLRETPKPSEPVIIWLRGRYEVVRRDNHVISLRYTIERYSNYSAHRGTETRVQNYSINPFQPLTIQELLISEKHLKYLSEIVRSQLLSPNMRKRNPESVIAGTKPAYENFNLFNLHEYAIEFTFETYQIGCGAEGITRMFIHYNHLDSIVKPNVLKLLQQNDGISLAMFPKGNG